MLLTNQIIKQANATCFKIKKKHASVLIAPQGFGPEAKTRGGIIETLA